MGKKTEIMFVGQPIFKKLLNLIDAANILSLVRQAFLACLFALSSAIATAA